MVSDKIISKQHKLVYLIATMINNYLQTKSWQAMAAPDIGTIKVINNLGQYAFYINVEITGLEYILKVNNNYIKPITLHDLFFFKNKCQSELNIWIECIIGNQKANSVEVNQVIVNYLNQLNYGNINIVFRLNGIFPEIFVDLDDIKGVAIFQVKTNFACFVIKEIESSKTFTVNYTDYIIGDDIEQHLTKWILNYVVK